MKAFLLGLGNSGVCLAYCAPVLIPYMAGSGGGVGTGCLVTLRFLCGRLAGYCLFGLLAWLVWRPLLAATGARELLSGYCSLVLALLLIRFGFTRGDQSCSIPAMLKRRDAPLIRRYVPELLGALTGVSLCPPFLLAFNEAAAAETVFGSVLFFICFFAGTAVLFMFLPLVGLLPAREPVQLTGRLACGVMGLYYLYTAVLLVAGGITIK